jgi:molybdopterin converting factor small subunit
VIPTHAGHHGHPIVLPWDVALRIRDLPDDAGVDRLVDRHRDNLLELPISGPGVIDDIDTPEDLESWLATRAGSGPRHEVPETDERDRTISSAETMSLAVRLFALARERAGRPQVEVELHLPATVGDLREALRDQIPRLGPLCAAAMISVDEEYAPDETPVHRGSRLAVIPPVSGGQGLS